MNQKNLLGILLIPILWAAITSPTFAADTLAPSDFKQEYWAKTIDYFDYIRNYAATYDITLPPAFSSWHANIYMVYINTGGLHVLYAGLINITFGGGVTLALPLQSVIMHYKTENRSRDVIMASNFLMLMAFNDTTTSLYPDSPDTNDILYSSYSIGFNIASLFPNNTAPSLHSKVSVIPLTHSDELHWTWGMRYGNLTSIWWRTFISPTNHVYNSTGPLALATYKELAFTYDLAISPETGRATLAENHVIGEVSNLWIFWWLLPPIYVHYNSTGCYSYNHKWSNETVHDYLQQQHTKMSIVDFQTSAMFDHTTFTRSAAGQNVTDSDNMVSNSSISTYADDGERIFDTSFGAKRAYKLYDNASDPTAYHVYNSTARTAKIDVFADNTDAKTHTRLFDAHIQFMKFLPYLVTHMNSQLYAKAKDTITNMTRANCFYLIAYPEYGGYRVEHDPILTVYLTTSSNGPSGNQPSLTGFIIIVSAVIAIVLLLAVVLIARRKPKQVPPPPPH